MMKMLQSIAISALLMTASAPAEAFDHTHRAFDQLLRTQVSEGRVQYGALSKNRAGLDSYTRGLATVTPAEEKRFSDRQALAFWINAYNALTLQLVIDEAPKKSIRDLGDPWKTFSFDVAGRKLTLDQIEHQIVRKRWKDPRIHAVLVCAAKSCPILESRVFVAATLDARLEAAARRWARDPSKNRREGGKLRVSRIFEWFGQDFVGRYGNGSEAVPDAVRGFLSHFLGEDIPATEPIEYMSYDWSLNGAW